MKRRLFAIIGVLALSLVLVAPVAAAPPDNPQPGKPDFSPHIYADGEAWGTKIGPLLPAPNGKNDQSFDYLVAVPDQLPVAEAAPGPEYNGGRWILVAAEWQVEPYLLMSFEDVEAAEAAGDLVVDWDNPVMYFLCPLLPVK